MLGALADQRAVFLLISLLFFTLIQRARRGKILLLRGMISRRLQRRRRASLLQVFFVLCWQHHHCANRIAWVHPRPQFWFENLLRSHALNTWWKENFRVSRLTFDYICRAVGPVIPRQDTILRAAIPVETRAAVGLWRLATGDSYRLCGLMFGIAKSTAIGVCQDFVQALCQLKDEFIKFPNTTAAVREKIEGFKEKSDFPNGSWRYRR